MRAWCLILIAWTSCDLMFAITDTAKTELEIGAMEYSEQRVNTVADCM